MLKELKLVAEQFKLMGELLYLYTLKFFLVIARDLLGGIVAIGYARSVMIFLISTTILVWYLTLLTN
ncbi:MAG: hypothetical protein OXH22_11635 [Chloroflexi bacterium]|nr:hypothetical protein [Chloroflexota bacterium]